MAVQPELVVQAQDLAAFREQFQQSSHARWRFAQRDCQFSQSRRRAAGLLQFGGAASAATRRIRSIELEMASARTEYEAQSKSSQSHGARSRMAERAVETAQGHYRQELEKKSLSELIEWSLQATNSGSHKP